MILLTRGTPRSQAQGERKEGGGCQGWGRGMESLLNGVLQIEKRPEGGWLHNSENALHALKMVEMVNVMLCVFPQLNV